MTPLIFAMPGNQALASALVRAGRGEAGQWQLHRFPDRESHVRFISPVAGRDVVIVCSLDDPDRKLVALFLAASVARELGARRIGLVLPYLAYMRQDCQFHDGEGVSAAHIGRWLAGLCDWLVTVDPHLHRIGQLGQVYPVPLQVVHAAPAIAAWIAAQLPAALIVGPDQESEQWVAAVAAAAGCPYIVLSKTRLGDREVAVSLPGIDAFRGRTPVLVDDIAASARTMMAGARSLVQAGMAAPWCVAVHALFAGSAYADLLAAGVAGVASCNTVPHPSNRIDLAPAIGAAVAAMLLAPSSSMPGQPP